MRKILIAFVMAVIALSLFSAVAEADVGDTGQIGYSGGATAVAVGADAFYGSCVYLPVRANITGFAGRYKVDSGQANWRFAIYSPDGLTNYYGSSVNPDSTKETYMWFNWTSTNFVTLDAGFYVVGMRSSTGGLYYNATSGGRSSIYAIDDGVASFDALPWTYDTYGGYKWNFLLNYTQTSIAVTEVTAQMISSDWLTFSALMTLSLICLILAWKSNVPIINFVFGVVTFGVGAYFLGANIVFAGWINILAILMASLCMLSGGMKLRGG